MARAAPMGRMACPECGFPDAEVREQKTPGLLYRYCPDCSAQFFARTPEASARLRQKIAPVPGTVSEQETETETKHQPARKGFGLGGL